MKKFLLLILATAITTTFKNSLYAARLTKAIRPTLRSLISSNLLRKSQQRYSHTEDINAAILFTTHQHPKPGPAVQSIINTLNNESNEILKNAFRSTNRGEEYVETQFPIIRTIMDRETNALAQPNCIAAPRDDNVSHLYPILAGALRQNNIHDSNITVTASEFATNNTLSLAGIKSGQYNLTHSTSQPNLITNFTTSYLLKINKFCVDYFYENPEKALLTWLHEGIHLRRSDLISQTILRNIKEVQPQAFLNVQRNHERLAAIFSATNSKLSAQILRDIYKHESSTLTQQEKFLQKYFSEHPNLKPQELSADGRRLLPDGVHLHPYSAAQEVGEILTAHEEDEKWRKTKTYPLAKNIL